jgi:GH35 family endo-1,4-beta-xylanase
VRYSDFVAAHEEDLTNLHNKHLETVLAHFKYDKNEWMEVVNELSISGTANWDTFLF